MDVLKKAVTDFDFEQKTAHLTFQADGAPPEFVIVQMRLATEGNETRGDMEKAASKKARELLNAALSLLGDA
jgi:hypothetical protein